MKRVSVTELKNRLSHYLRLVKRGETVELLDRNVPVARLTRVDAVEDEDLIRRLQRDGLIRPPAGKPYLGFLDSPPLPCKGDAVKALIEGRGDR